MTTRTLAYDESTSNNDGFSPKHWGRQSQAQLSLVVQGAARFWTQTIADRRCDPSAYGIAMKGLSKLVRDLSTLTKAPLMRSAVCEQRDGPAVYTGNIMLRPCRTAPFNHRTSRTNHCVILQSKAVAVAVICPLPSIMNNTRVFPASFSFSPISVLLVVESAAEVRHTTITDGHFDLRHPLVVQGTGFPLTV